MKYVYRAVDRIPAQLDEGTVYHNEDFELAGLLCACGCGHRITLLVPDSHQVWNQNGLATINPSIGVFDAACKSHFFIIGGAVDWLPAFSGTQAASIMQTQIARHAAGDMKSTWMDRLKAIAASVFRRIKTVFAGRAR